MLNMISKGYNAQYDFKESTKCLNMCSFNGCIVLLRKLWSVYMLVC